MARLDCGHFVRGECRSCGWIERDYAAQLAEKQRVCRELIDPSQHFDWLPAQPSALAGFRNKAKLVVGGSVEAPTLGILDGDGRGVDLPHCALYEPGIVACLPTLRALVQRAGLTPYRVPERRGELKYLLLSIDPPSGRLMLRVVLRSQEALGRLRREQAWLRAELPGLQVLSVNLQPLHAAIVEGEEEILLDGDSHLTLGINDVQLRLQPGGFWQTNTEVAAALYRQARDWCRELPLSRVLDLYCGIGGFAQHLVAPGREIRGVEIHPAAVASAALGQASAPGPAPRFERADADAVDASLLTGLDLLVVNPPRRGISGALCEAIEQAAPAHLLYSSCNPQSLARDLARLPSYLPRKARLFDMFPHTPHSEVLVFVEHRDHPGNS
ncbi:methyltransferase domain-containing protein [Pseudomarimonas salicorniae]|uniref:Methyltransferase domain-containing protein n=1 Tax=Pseudomarimonas salicorniae TaxID=2933270 RepID=A0ABT0GEY1_9GAMM|nr:methyltransferase domain-containing protein [Lysobacter sp. CAU 1642]MCK7593104.1 methyltransferase domain-containing protein [Lysobacter sp. CAU 1642]